MKILNLGSCNIDYVYSLEAIVREGETVRAKRMDVFCGGKGLNQSIALSRAGATVYHAGCIGYDGDTLKEVLLDSGVDTSYLKTVDTKNGHAIIQVDGHGENSIIIYEGSNGSVTKEYINTVLNDFDSGDMLLLQNEISNVDYAVNRAHEKGMCIMLNPSPINDRIYGIDLGKLNYIILNEIEAQELSGCGNCREALTVLNQKYPKLKIMLTLGSKGCVYYDGEELVECPAFKTEAVDTTGAGDTFTGYFAKGISSGEDISLVLRTASAAAAIAVSRKGAAPSIPKADEVKLYLEKVFGGE